MNVSCIKAKVWYSEYRTNTSGLSAVWWVWSVSFPTWCGPWGLLWAGLGERLCLLLWSTWTISITLALNIWGSIEQLVHQNDLLYIYTYSVMDQYLHIDSLGPLNEGIYFTHPQTDTIPTHHNEPSWWRDPCSLHSLMLWKWEKDWGHLSSMAN